MCLLKTFTQSLPQTHACSAVSSHCWMNQPNAKTLFATSGARGCSAPTALSPCPGIRMSSPLARGQPGAVAPTGAKKRGPGKRKAISAEDATFTKPPTLCITHTQCLKHYVRDKYHPEQPARVASVVASLRGLLEEQFQGDGPESFLFHIMEMSSSNAMLGMLEAQLSELTQAPPTKGISPALKGLQRTESVDYLETTILPAVRAVHTHNYLEKLRATCQHLTNRALNKPNARFVKCWQVARSFSR